MLIFLLLGQIALSNDLDLYPNPHGDRHLLSAGYITQDARFNHGGGFLSPLSRGVDFSSDRAVIFHQALGDCEQSIYETINKSWRSEPLTMFMKGVEVISSPGLDVLPPIGLCLCDKKDVARTGIFGFIGDCLTVLPMKFLVNRTRPEETSSRIDSSFPSGHATFAFTQAVVYSHYNPKLRLPMFLYATVVGFSRIYLGKHYPTDVLGGAVLGIAVGFLAIRISD
jgi:hypothetical protein